MIGAAMDFEEDFGEAVNIALSSLKRKDKEPQSWTADNGHSIVGWRFDGTSFNEMKGNPGNGNWWKETWIRCDYILAVDGKFWIYQVDATEEYRQPDYSCNSLREMPPHYLVGSTGKPFSKAKGQIERLPYL